MNVSDKPPVSMFRMAYSSVKMESAGFSETFIPIHWTTRRHIPRNHNLVVIFIPWQSKIRSIDTPPLCPNTQKIVIRMSMDDL
jgi:hypothetical protein